MKLQSHETDLAGKWIIEEGKARGDATCERIEWLIAHQLKQVGFSPQWGAWETLFQDPDDGRYWERIYPQAEMHGGGPPELRCLSSEDAAQKYGNVVTAKP